MTAKKEKAKNQGIAMDVPKRRTVGTMLTETHQRSKDRFGGPSGTPRRTAISPR